MIFLGQGGRVAAAWLSRSGDQRDGGPQAALDGPSSDWRQRSGGGLAPLDGGAEGFGADPVGVPLGDLEQRLDQGVGSSRRGSRPRSSSAGRRANQ